VLVTGATGFIAQHCILQLLDAGYLVRGTARAPGRATEIADILRAHLSPTGLALVHQEFDVVVADLTSDAGWDAAVKDCRFVLHVASPLPRGAARSDDELIVPARDGALRLLTAASRSGVERVVLTSSMSAIAYGNDRSRTFNEDDWSNLAGTRIGAYDKSKTIAERAAWDFMATLGPESSMELVSVNPGLVLGPLLSSDWGTSGELVKRIIDHAVPAIPDINFACVDVRDVACAHVAAMVTPEASGLRFICAEGDHSMMEIARILKEYLGPRGYKIPTKRLPLFIIRLMALFDRTIKLALNDLGTSQKTDNERIRRILHWTPRDLREMTTSMADSMIEYGVVATKW
ncbi:MAG: aldehyde reductase, partial [Acidimicrobiales bacterium]